MEIVVSETAVVQSASLSNIMFCFYILTTMLSVLALIPLAVLSVECLAALLPARRQKLQPLPLRQRTVVLVPAHNEEGIIGRTLQAIIPQLGPCDGVVVVADNCSDRTVEEAARTGATVVVRDDPAHRGKGYALDFGLRTLEDDPPQVVVIIDADSQVHADTIDILAREAAQGYPVQGLYLLAPASPDSKQALSSLAFLFKNQVRPAGLSRLGMPCLLAGTGMAFPWPIIATAPLAHGNIVEDMQLGIDLAIKSTPARFCPDAKVSGVLPSSARVAATQRTRWEHGHMRTILTQVPRLLGEAIRQRRLDLLCLAVDVSVPPLSLLVALLAVVSAMAVAAMLAGLSWTPVALMLFGWVVLALTIATAWWCFAREIVPAKFLLTIPGYVLSKLPIYLKFVFRQQKAWVRTERDLETAKQPE